jgi:hypothetical protein
MKQKTKDNLIYLGVAGTIAAALTFYLFYTDKTMGRTPEIPGRCSGAFSLPPVFGSDTGTILGTSTSLCAVDHIDCDRPG